MLADLAERFPTNSLAAHALYKIGELNELETGDYDAAAAAYRRVIETYPTQGIARRARGRLERLDRGRGSGDVPLRVFDRVRHDYQKLGSDRALAEMESLYARYPNFAQRDKVLFWIAEERRRRDEFDAAILAYRELLATYPTGKWAYFAALNVGQSYLEKRDFAAAIAAFEQVKRFAATNPGAVKNAELSIEVARRFRLLRWLFRISLAVAIAIPALWLCRTRWRALTRADLRRGALAALIAAAAPALGFVFMIGRGALYTRTLAWTAALLALAAFLHRLYAARRDFTARGRVVAALALAVVALALVFTAYYATDLVNLLYDSIQYERLYGGQ